MKYKVIDIIDVLEQWAPTHHTRVVGQSGLCIGNTQTPVTVLSYVWIVRKKLFKKQSLWESTR